MNGLGVRNEDTLFDVIGAPSLPGHFYVHVPFCSSKCAYCDFASVEQASPRTVIAVFRGLEAEVRRWGHTSLPGVVETVYVGGGTPSLHAHRVARLLRRVSAELPLRDGVEVTVEANPDSTTDKVAQELAAAGANRLSIGVQSLDDGVLRFLGRAHTAEQAWRAIGLAVEVFADVSADLMCGVPGQTLESWLGTVSEVARSGVSHVSVYPLSVEEGTPLAAEIETGRVRSPDQDLAAEMMLAAEGILERAGLMRYEVANYAVPGCESRHNLAYWTGHQYAGIGPGAHSMYDAGTAAAVGMLNAADTDAVSADRGRVRTAEAADPEGWLAGRGFSIEVLSSDEAVREDLMLGMRLTRGVSVDAVKRAGLESVLESLANEGLVVRQGRGRAARWRTTTRGWLLGNEVFGGIWTAEDPYC